MYIINLLKPLYCMPDICLLITKCKIIMPYQYFVSLVVFLLSFSTGISAVEETTNTYTEPTELSNEDWKNFKYKIHVYNGCLREEMVQWVNKGSDPRFVSNKVLESCSFHLEELKNQMNEKNLDPNFTDRYIYINKNKAGKQMLGAIMMLMSQQQEAKQTENTEPTVNTTNQE